MFVTPLYTTDVGVSKDSSRVLCWDNSLQNIYQRGQIARDDFPHDILIHSQIIMDNPVSHADDFSPRNRRKAQLTLRRNVACRLPDHLHQVGQSKLHILVESVLVSVEFRCSLARFAGHVQHMAEVEKVIRSHIEPQLP